MRDIWTIIKKELKRFFTDKRMLLTLILPGLLIYLLYTFMGSAITDIYTADKDYEYIVLTINEPEELGIANAFETAELNVDSKAISEEKKEDTLESIKNKESDLLVIYSENFYPVVSGQETSEDTPSVEIYYNSSKTESSTIYSAYVSLLSSIEQYFQPDIFSINGGEANYDLATSEDSSAQYFSMMLPFLILTFLASGCMSIAPESIAGEKERGTLSTLLVTPLKRTNLAMGKIISLSIVALVSALSSFLGTILSLPNLAQSMGNVTLDMYTGWSYAMVLLVIVSTVLVIIGLIAIVSAFAKSVKEASGYASIPMILIMLVSVSSMLSGTGVSDPLLYLIPVYNSAQALTAIFSLTITPLNFVITIVSNSVYTVLFMFILSKMFNSERIMFSK